MYCPFDDLRAHQRQVPSPPVPPDSSPLTTTCPTPHRCPSLNDAQYCAQCGSETAALCLPQLFVPLPGGEAAGLYGGLQYDLPRAVRFVLLTTHKSHAGLHLDFR
jgi:hypothetical protein